MALFIIFLLFSTLFGSTIGCYTTIFSFGDSLADTGNLISILHSSGKDPFIAHPPYGDTYFHRPTGRFCDGRLIIDFIAQHLGFDLIPPYFGHRNVNPGDHFKQGVNFAVGGATAMENESKISLPDQLTWFKDILPSFCGSPLRCKQFLKTSLFLVGEIGGNDYNFPILASNMSIAEVRTLVNPVINVIGSSIIELIEMGAITLIVPGNLPIGCIAIYLNHFNDATNQDYDPKTGCISWLNEFSQYHNEKLLEEINKIRISHPRVNVIYADYYNIAMKLFESPGVYGFGNGAMSACCGCGGPYNANQPCECGEPSANICADPSAHISWDGSHLTEAAYKWISKGVLEKYVSPLIESSKCISSI